jgi:hypothetical protein
MAIAKDLRDKAKMTREDGVSTLKLDEGVSLAMLVSFAEDMFPGVSTEDIGVWRSMANWWCRFVSAEQLASIDGRQKLLPRLEQIAAIFIRLTPLRAFDLDPVALAGAIRGVLLL